jgi:predicted dinucleotide-binding enzyme
VPEACDQGEVIFLAVPAAAAVDALSNAPIGDKVVVDCNNPVTWVEGPVWSPPTEGSVTAQLAARYPEARWVKGFSTFGSEFHRNPTIGDSGIDVHLAGDDAEAKDTVFAIAQGAGFQPVDVGPLRNAAALENLAILWIHLALQGGHGRQIAFQLQRRSTVG